MGPVPGVAVAEGPGPVTGLAGANTTLDATLSVPEAPRGVVRGPVGPLPPSKSSTRISDLSPASHTGGLTRGRRRGREDRGPPRRRLDTTPHPDNVKFNRLYRDRDLSRADDWTARRYDFLLFFGK